MSACLLKQYPQFYQNGRFYAYAVGVENGCEVTYKVELSRDEFERVMYPVLEREYTQRNGLVCNLTTSLYLLDLFNTHDSLYKYVY